jgi:hypothetical protein
MILRTRLSALSSNSFVLFVSFVVKQLCTFARDFLLDKSKGVLYI